MNFLEKVFREKSSYKALLLSLLLSAFLGLCNSIYAATIKTGKKGLDGIR